MGLSESKLLRRPNPAPISRVVCVEKVPKEIKIKVGAWWYSERIGEIFNVLEIHDDFYTIFDKSNNIIRYVLFKHISMKLN